MTVLQGGRTRRTSRRRPPGARRQSRQAGHARHRVALTIGVLALTAGALLGFMAARATGPATIAFRGAVVTSKQRPATPPKPVRGAYGIAAGPAGRARRDQAEAPAEERAPVRRHHRQRPVGAQPGTGGPDREPHEDDDRARRRRPRPAEREGADHAGRARLQRLGRRAAAAGQACAAGGAALRPAAAVGQRRRDRARPARRRNPVAIHRDDERRSAEPGFELHPFHDRLRDRRSGQPLVRDGPGPDRARRSSSSRFWPGSSLRPARSCRSRSRAASCGCTTTIRCWCSGYPGTDGVKTGFTDAAGACLVATARRGAGWLGVVLLHSGDTYAQAKSLLNAGFAKRGL